MRYLALTGRNLRSALAEDGVMLRTGEVAELFEVAPGTVSRWKSAGKLDYVLTPGGGVRYLSEDIRVLLQRRREREAGGDDDDRP